MGLFDSLMVTCPMCGDRDEIQVKPVDVAGDMTTFHIETAPGRVLERAAFCDQYCSCGCIYSVVNDGGFWALRVGKDIPISELPKRVEWQELDSDSPKSRDVQCTADDGAQLSSDRAVIDVDAAIAFDSGVDCRFFATMLKTASRHWNVGLEKIDIPSSEALRRSAALMEAVLTKQVTVKQSR